MSRSLPSTTLSLPPQPQAQPQAPPHPQPPIAAQRPVPSVFVYSTAVPSTPSYGRPVAPAPTKPLLGARRTYVLVATSVLAVMATVLFVVASRHVHVASAHAAPVAPSAVTKPASPLTR